MNFARISAQTNFLKQQNWTDRKLKDSDESGGENDDKIENSNIVSERVKCHKIMRFFDWIDFRIPIHH